MGSSRTVFIFFSRFLKRDVVDKNNNFIGVLHDVTVLPIEVYPKLTDMVIVHGVFLRRYTTVSWSKVVDFDGEDIRVDVDSESLKFSTAEPEPVNGVSLCRDILDQQIIDTFHHNVIRVNDVHLLRVNFDLMLAHVDIGTRGIIRRLGFEQIVDFIFKVFFRNSSYLSNNKLIRWKFVQLLSINPISKTIKVNVPQHQLRSIPTADFSEIIEDLDPKYRSAFFKVLDIQNKSRIFAELDFKSQKLLIRDLSDKESVEILREIPPDEAVDFLSRMSRGTTNKLLSLMEGGEARRLSTLLGYSSDTAGGLMTTEYIALSQDMLIKNVLQEIKAESTKVETIQYVFVVDENNCLVGTISLKRLIVADQNDTIMKAAFPKTVSVNVDAGVKEVAYLMEKYRFFAIPVVDDDKKLQGIITMDDIFEQVVAIAWREFRKD
ncbi:magnesium transporter MgtE N-terminal domain-containing protein [Candidatus Omnitrophota bacterium]